MLLFNRFCTSITSRFWLLAISLWFTVSFRCQAQATPCDSEDVFTVVEAQPRFPGGEAALYNYLQSTVIYPESARKAGVKGRVFVTFVVRKDGQLTDVATVLGLHPACDEEALRVVRAMPRWKPGQQSGCSVHVKFNIPISFGVPDAFRPKK